MCELVSFRFRFRLHRKARRTFAALPPFPHLEISGFNMPAVAIGIEQRLGKPVAGESFAQFPEQRGLGRDPQSKPLVRFQIIRNEVGHADSSKQACCHAPRESLTAAGDDRQSSPQGVGGGCMRVVRQGVEEKVG